MPCCFPRFITGLLLGTVALLPFEIRAHSPHDHIEAFEIGPGSEGTGTVMLIVVRGNLWRSADRGASWKRIVRGLDNRHEISEIAFEPLGDEVSWFLKTRNDGTVYFSGDDGWSWRSLPKGMRYPGVRSPEFIPAAESLKDKRITSVLNAGEGWIFVSTWEDGVFVSSDSGTTWEQRSRGLTTDPQGDRRGLPQFTTLRQAPEGSETLFLAGYDGLFRSDDDGRNWMELETLPETLLIDFDLSPNHAEDGELVATTYWKGAFWSGDRGETWQPINGAVAPSRWDHLKRKLKGDDEYAQIVRFHSIAFSPNYSKDRTVFAGLRNWFLVSADRVADWERIELTQFANGEDVIPDRIVFSDRFAEDGTLFFCSRLGEGKTRRGGVFRSTDRGSTFSLVHEAEGKYLQSLVISPAFSEDGTVLVSSARGGNNSDVFRTRDGGETWEIVTGDLQFVDYGAELAISPEFARDRTVWAGTEKGWWRTADGGDSWTRLNSGAFSEEGFVDMVALSPNFAEDRTLVVAVKGEGLFVSRDAGESFQEFRPELFEANHQFNRLWSYSPGAMLKFAGSEIYGMTGEELFRFDESEASSLPVRAVARKLGEPNLVLFWAIVAAAGSALLALGWVVIQRRLRQPASSAE